MRNLLRYSHRSGVSSSLNTAKQTYENKSSSSSIVILGFAPYSSISCAIFKPTSFSASVSPKSLYCKSQKGFSRHNGLSAYRTKLGSALFSNNNRTILIFAWRAACVKNVVLEFGQLGSTISMFRFKLRTSVFASSASNQRSEHRSSNLFFRSSTMFPLPPK